MSDIILTSLCRPTLWPVSCGQYEKSTALPLCHRWFLDPQAIKHVTWLRVRHVAVHCVALLWFSIVNWRLLDYQSFYCRCLSLTCKQCHKHSLQCPCLPGPTSMWVPSPTAIIVKYRVLPSIHRIMNQTLGCSQSTAHALSTNNSCYWNYKRRQLMLHCHLRPPISRYLRVVPSWNSNYILYIILIYRFCIKSLKFELCTVEYLR